MAYGKRKSTRERFQEKIEISKDNEWNGSPCWDWTGANIGRVRREKVSSRSPDSSRIVGATSRRDLGRSSCSSSLRPSLLRESRSSLSRNEQGEHRRQRGEGKREAAEGIESR